MDVYSWYTMTQRDIITQTVIVEYPIKIREGLVLRLMLPSDISINEVEHICSMLKTIPFPVKAHNENIDTV